MSLLENNMSKPKRKSKLVEYELLPNEDVLWQGHPVVWKLFNAHDLYLIPFSLFWCAITVPMFITGLRSGNLIFIILPHAWIGLYILFGRFIYKIIRKQHTLYIVTNRRVLLIHHLLGKRVQAFNLDHLPGLEKAVGLAGIGNITFGDTVHKTWWNRGQTNYSNTGMDIFGHTIPGFYDIHDVEQVFQLIVELTYHPIWEQVEKNKPAFLPH
jgi:hypothetical protein